MKYISLISILFFFSVGCGDSKLKEVSTAKSETEKALTNAEDYLKVVEMKIANVNDTLAVMNYTEEDINKADPEIKNIMENCIDRISKIKSDYSQYYISALQLKDELAGAKQQLNTVETKMKEGVSYDDAIKEIDINTLNTTELLQTIETNGLEFEKFNVEQQPTIDKLLYYHKSVAKS